MIFFASDFHLGAPGLSNVQEHEQKVIAWLRSIRGKATELFLMGDLFDFWFEFKHVIPKGHTGFISELYQLKESGVQIHIFKGNHDLWFKDYFEQELGAKVYSDPQVIVRNGIKLYLAHGDGLGPGDRGYKFIKWVFTRRLFQWMFRWFHPDLGISIARFWSKKSSSKSRDKDAIYLGEDKEWLIIHSKAESQKDPEIKYFVYGHRHLPMELALNEHATYVNLGDWLSSYTYAQLDGEQLSLMSWGPEPAI